jgi:hypothetical protein
MSSRRARETGLHGEKERDLDVGLRAGIENSEKLENRVVADDQRRIALFRGSKTRRRITAARRIGDRALDDELRAAVGGDGEARPNRTHEIPPEIGIVERVVHDEVFAGGFAARDDDRFGQARRNRIARRERHLIRARLAVRVDDDTRNRKRAESPRHDDAVENARGRRRGALRAVPALALEESEDRIAREPCERRFDWCTPVIERSVHVVRW